MDEKKRRECLVLLIQSQKPYDSYKTNMTRATNIDSGVYGRAFSEQEIIQYEEAEKEAHKFYEEYVRIREQVKELLGTKEEAATFYNCVKEIIEEKKKKKQEGPTWNYILEKVSGIKLELQYQSDKEERE